jgi:hypothetical protein
VGKPVEPPLGPVTRPVVPVPVLVWHSPIISLRGVQLPGVAVAWTAEVVLVRLESGLERWYRAYEVERR